MLLNQVHASHRPASGFMKSLLPMKSSCCMYVCMYVCVSALWLLINNYYINQLNSPINWYAVMDMTKSQNRMENGLANRLAQFH